MKHDILFLLKCCINLAGCAYFTLKSVRGELLCFSRGLGQADVPWQSCSGQRVVSGKLSELSGRYCKNSFTGMALVEAQYIGIFCSVEVLGSFPFLVPAPNIFVAFSIFNLLHFIPSGLEQKTNLQLAVQAASIYSLKTNLI